MTNENNLAKRVLYCARNCGIHGIGRLAEKNANFFARLFWFVVILVSAGCLYLLLLSVLEHGGVISFTPDSLYLDWTTTYPAVTVCESYNKKLWKTLTQEYPELMEPLDFSEKSYVTEVVYGGGTCTRTVCTPCGGKVPCNVPWRDIIEHIHKKCPDILSECNFNGVEFPCCQLFRAVDSENGPCYSLNTLQNIDSDKVAFFVVNRTTGPGVLTFRLMSEAKVSIHSNEELSSNNLISDYKFDVNPLQQHINRIQYLFSIVEIENEPVLEMEDIRDRGCRYLYEVPDLKFHTYQVYSYGACKLAYRTARSFAKCGCIHPVRDMSYEKYYCNFTGINCLQTYEADLKFHGVSDEDLGDCIPSCVESELTRVHITKWWVPEEAGLGTLVSMRMGALPSLRYQRNLLRTNLDLVVSIGGMVGLFFGASILSLIEVVYLIFRGPDNTLIN